MSKQERCKCARNYSILDSGIRLTDLALSERSPYSLEQMEMLWDNIQHVGRACELDVSDIQSQLEEMNEYVEKNNHTLARVVLDKIVIDMDTKLLKCSIGE